MVLIGSLVRPAFWQMRLDWTTLKIAAAHRGRLSRRRRSSADRHGANWSRSRISLRRRARGRAGNPGAAQARSARLQAVARDQRRHRARARLSASRRPLRHRAGGRGRRTAHARGRSAEGTDGMLARVAELRATAASARRGTGVLVKAPKPAQDRRFDLPSIGPKTVEGVGTRGPCRHRRRRRRNDRRRAGRAWSRRPTAPAFSWSACAGSARMTTPRRPPHVFLVAGEESGDRLGAALIAALNDGDARHVRVSGVGGAHMAAAGVVSPFPLGDLAIIGFAAIPARLPLILRRIREAADAVIAAKPDVLVIIDSPDFTHRVAQRVRARAPQIPIVDYVCPSVWAWRPGRARAMRAYVDQVLALLPFEPAAMRRLGGPPTDYVGHPLAEQVGASAPRRRRGEAAARRPAASCWCMPGSRRGEIRRMAARVRRGGGAGRGTGRAARGRGAGGAAARGSGRGGGRGLAGRRRALSPIRPRRTRPSAARARR